jgi:hypothetical protein
VPRLPLTHMDAKGDKKSGFRRGEQQFRGDATQHPRLAGRAPQGTLTAAALEAVTSHNATVSNQHLPAL